MKKTGRFSVRRFRNIKQKDMSRCLSCFKNPEFYFFTKRPDSLIPGNISSIINEALVFTDEKDRAVGLIKSDSNFFGNNNTMVLEFHFAESEYYTNSIGEKLLAGFMHEQFMTIVRVLNKILIRVYGFDQTTKDFLDHYEIPVEVTLKNQVFKSGTYHNVLIYSVLKEEFLNAK